MTGVVSGLLDRARRGLGAATSENLLARLVTLSFVGRAGYLLIGFVAAVELARFLGPADRGLLALMISVVTLGMVLATFGLTLSSVYYSSRKDTDQGALLGNTVVQGLILAVVLIPLAAIIYQPLADAFGEGRGGHTWILVAALIPVTFWDWAIHSQLQGMLMFGRYTVILLISRLSYAVAILILVGILPLGVTGGLIATGVASVVMVVGSLRPILERGRLRIDWALWKRSMHYGVRVQIGSLFQFANGRLDVLIMQFFRPLSQVGYYAIAETVAELLINVAGAFQISVMPLISHYESGGEEQTERAEAASSESLRHYGILAAVAAVGLALIGPGIIYFAFGPQFEKAIVPMLILLPGVWFLGIAVVIQGDLSGRGRPGLSSVLAGIAAGATVVLDLVLIPPLGVYGGAIASDVAYTTYGVGSLIALSSVTGIAVRRLIVPTAADFGLYARLTRQGASAVRKRLRARHA